MSEPTPATKAHIDALQTDIQSMLADNRSARAEIHSMLAETRAEMHKELSGMRVEMHKELSGVRIDMANLRAEYGRLIPLYAGIGGLAGGLIAAAIKIF